MKDLVVSHSEVLLLIRESFASVRIFLSERYPWKRVPNVVQGQKVFPVTVLRWLVEPTFSVLRSFLHLTF